MIESVVALLMFVNAEIKEARLQSSMAECLRGKRHAERQYSESVMYKCWYVTYLAINMLFKISSAGHTSKILFCETN